MNRIEWALSDKATTTQTNTDKTKNEKKKKPKIILVEKSSESSVISLHFNDLSYVVNG